MYEIRLARREEIAHLPAVEIACGRLFAEIGMADVAAHEPTALEIHAAALALGRLWVAARADVPVGFALVEEIDGCAHLEEIAVHPDHGRQGLGARLVEAVAAWAAQAGFPALTLSTFRDVAWNGPFYRHHGFRELRPDEWTPGLYEARRHEAEAGLDLEARILMRRELA